MSTRIVKPYPGATLGMKIGLHFVDLFFRGFIQLYKWLHYPRTLL